MLTRIYLDLVVLRRRVKERAYRTLRFLHEERDGIATVEYALLIGGITFSLVAAIAIFYGVIAPVFEKTAYLIPND